jgi:hypothetical protein
MRRQLKFSLIFSLVIALTYLSNDNGRSTGTTGAPGEPDEITCENCHLRGNFKPIMEIELLSNNAKVSTIKPATTYTLNVKIGDQTGKAKVYGFQLVPLTSKDAMAGTFPTIGAKVKRVNTLGRTYLTHSSPNSNTVFSATWTSPANLAPEDSITFYYAGVTGDNQDSSVGDNAISGKSSYVFPLASSNKDISINKVKVYPSHTRDFLQLQTNSDLESLDIKIYDQYGRLVLTEVVQHNKIDVSEISPGLYYISIYSKATLLSSTNFVKL